MQLPEPYALCTDPGKVYTVDEVKPNMDYMLVRRDRIMATAVSVWTSSQLLISFHSNYDTEDAEVEYDAYQNELIAKFMTRRRKPSKVLNTPPGSIVVSGLGIASVSGTGYVAHEVSTQLCMHILAKGPSF
ncbi:hypothetical protein AcW1_002163 [Taiwanofungus camphoratus]|nr:hypothetical protein AcV5_010154 [Antrodia cinnamomea]KAI0944460.1 hypothetical protein AcW1_002163 [Antrodia cinnamomea]KAI0946115.1 hypothetical protein AcV7_010173 [Antrodia cinnamomea]